MPWSIERAAKLAYSEQIEVIVSTRPSSRRLTVGGEVFEVRPSEHHHGYDFDWVTGPNSGYGFSGNGARMDDEALVAQIRSFLQQIDPATGYIAD